MSNCTILEPGRTLEHRTSVAPPAETGEGRELLINPPRPRSCGEPALSIVIPTRNRPEYLSRALFSLGPLESHVEVIVVDDGSDPESRWRNRSLCSHIRACRYECLSRTRGASAARNLGLRLSRGRYVWFLDDDDYPTPRTLSDVLSQSTSGSDQEVLLLSRLIVQKGTPVRLDVPANEQNKWERYRRVGVEVTTSCAVFPRRILIDLEGWDELLPALQDADLFLRAARIATFRSIATDPVRVDVGAPERITNAFVRSQVGKVKFLKKHWHVLPLRRRARYLAQLLSGSPLFRSLRARRQLARALRRPNGIDVVIDDASDRPSQDDGTD